MSKIEINIPEIIGLLAALYGMNTTNVPLVILALVMIVTAHKWTVES